MVSAGLQNSRKVYKRTGVEVSGFCMAVESAQEKLNRIKVRRDAKIGELASGSKGGYEGEEP